MSTTIYLDGHAIASVPLANLAHTLEERGEYPEGAYFLHLGKQYPATAESAATIVARAARKQAARDGILAANSAAEGAPVDAESLQGTIADAASLTLAACAADLVSLADSDDFAAYRAGRLAGIAQLTPDGNSEALIDASRALLAGLGAGELLLTVQVKGIGPTMQDIAQRSTMTARALQSVIADNGT